MSTQDKAGSKKLGWNEAEKSGHQANGFGGAFWKGVGLATLVSGTLDATAGIVVYFLILGRMNIIQILQWIASGVFGKEAFDMGLMGAFYGVVFHYLIAVAFSLFAFVIYKKMAVFSDYPVFSGLSYGAAVWLVMNLIVLPNSNTVMGSFEPGVALTGVIWHMLLVGAPIVLIAKSF
jgi:hypothetical protein